MNVILTALELDRALGDAWERHCGDLPGVTVFRGAIREWHHNEPREPAPLIR